MKTWLWLILVFFLPAKRLLAQEEHYAGKVLLTLGASYLPLSGDSRLNAFHKDYESYWASSLDKGYSRSPLAGEAFAGLEYWLTQGLGFRYAARFHTMKQSFRLKGGEGREEKMRIRIPLEFTVLFGNPKKLSAGLGFGVGTSRFVNAYRYSDGTESLNYEYSLNGVFSSSAFSYRMEVNYTLTPRLWLTAALTGLVGSEYTDKNTIRGIDDRFGVYETVYFPSDYPLYVQTAGAGQSFDYPVDKALKCRYLAISLGVQYRISLFRAKVSL